MEYEQDGGFGEDAGGDPNDFDNKNFIDGGTRDDVSDFGVFVVPEVVTLCGGLVFGVSCSNLLILLRICMCLSIWDWSLCSWIES
jgi:hypothetical protein